MSRSLRNQNVPDLTLTRLLCPTSSPQEAASRRLLAHCGIPWEPAVLRFHETQRTVATASLAQVGLALVTVRGCRCSCNGRTGIDGLKGSDSPAQVPALPRAR